MKTPAVPFIVQTFIIEAGATLPVPGQFTWLEILSEFETEDPTVNSQGISVNFNTTGGASGAQTLPPGITVIADDAFPFVNIALANTSDVSITVTLAGGAGEVAVDHRVTLPVGVFLDVTVQNTTANPIPVSDVVTLGTQFDLAATATVVLGADNINGVVLQLAGCYSVGGGSDAVISSGGKGLCFAGADGQMMIPYPIIIPPGGDLTVSIAGTAHGFGTYTIL